MKKVFVMIIISVITMVQVSYADDASRRALAEELLILMKVQENMEEAFEMAKEMQVAQLQDVELSEEELSEEMQSRIQKMMDTIDMISEELFNWDDLKDDYIRIYADIFTEEELRGIIKFYKSPIGQKFVEKTPEVMRKLGEVGQRQMPEFMRKIQSITEEVEENMEEENQESFFNE